MTTSRTRLRDAKRFLLAPMALSLAACGGGDGSMSFIPPAPASPTPTPTPSPTPTPNPGAPATPLLAAQQTASPPSPPVSGSGFASIAQATDFPLLMTAATGGGGSGDLATTASGGVLTARPGGSYLLTINNPAVGIRNIEAAQSTRSGFFNITTVVGSDNLDYTRFGYWSRDDGVDGVFNLGAFSTGFVTPASNIPINGTATYSGKATGLYNAPIDPSSFVDFNSKFTGDVNLTANFGQSTLSGSIRNITATSLYSNLSGPVNDIGFSASIDRSSNLFNGTTSVTSQPSGIFAFGPTAGGLINGRFYGPTANEIGAVFSVSEGDRRLIGSFGAKGP